MKEQLISRITEKTGISEEQASSAADTVIEFLKEKMPAPIAGQIDNYLGGGEGGEGGGLADTASGMVGGLGGMFGGGDKGE